MVTRNQEVSLKLSTLCDMVQENILGAMFSFSSDNEKEEVSKRERERVVFDLFQAIWMINDLR